MLGFLAVPADAGTASGRVIDVVDGDSLTAVIRGRETKVRLLYIDAPEHDQPSGREARRSLEQLVRLEPVTFRLKGRDRYGRALAVVIRGSDGRDINLEQVARGLAWAYSRGEFRPEYRAAERAAREARIGLWRDAAPVPPGTWRRRARNR
jgi:endonuclease YncB( thermonuclease family)